MRVEFLNEQQFWKQMCSPSFRRTSLYTGVNGDILFIAKEAPERAPEFWKELSERIMDAIK